jgi:DNA-binding NtrC family response regulator
MKKDIKDLPGGNETILLVDDNDAVWDVLIESMQALGYSVILAENGLDAVEIYKANPNEIDIVVLDMIMPKMGGHNAFFELKATDPNVKVLLISGYVSEKEVNDILKEGAKGFLSKPCRINMIADELRRILDEK